MGNPGLVSPVGGTGIAATPSCNNFLVPVAPAPTVDNHTNTYMFVVFPSATNASTRFRSFRVFYRLQVSPPPGTATFTDVPTSHPLFEFVEALAGSGITAGCGGGNFCPNDPLTRGQMAVFLSKALGLHWGL